MKKQVITIDFDVIMAPSIPFYNPMVPGMNWDEILTYPMAQNFQVDYNLYYKLTEYLTLVSKKITKDQIVFVTNHDQVNEYLDKNETYNIINIDHHHDLGYGDSAQDTATLNCSNWVKILKDNKQCVSYTWIHNENSELEIERENMYTDAILKDTDLQYLPTPDKLFIVVSPPWIPPYCMYLLDCWFVMLNALYNTDFKLY